MDDEHFCGNILRDILNAWVLWVLWESEFSVFFGVEASQNYFHDEIFDKQQREDFWGNVCAVKIMKSMG